MPVPPRINTRVQPKARKIVAPPKGSTGVSGKTGTASYIYNTPGVGGRALGGVSRLFSGLSILAQPQILLQRLGPLVGGGLMMAGNLLPALGSSKIVTENKVLDNTVGKATRGIGSLMSLPTRVFGITPGSITDDTMHVYDNDTQSVHVLESVGAQAQRLAGDKFGATAENAVKSSREGLAFIGRNITTAAGSVVEMVGNATNMQDRMANKLANNQAKYDVLAKAARNATSKKGGDIGSAVSSLDRAASLMRSNPQAAHAKLKEAKNELANIEGTSFKQRRKFNAYASAITREHGLQDKSDFWKNPVQRVKEDLKHTSGTKLVMDGTRYLQMASSGYEQYGRIGEYVRGLKAMVAELEGTSPQDISTRRILFGKMPEVMKSARKKFWTAILPSATLTVGSIVADRKIAKGVSRATGGNEFISGMAHNAVFGAIDMAGKMVEGHASFVPVYSMLKAKEEMQEALTPNEYLNMLVAAHPDLVKTVHKAGGDLDMLATQYHRNKSSVSEVMSDINEGKDKLVNLTLTVEDIVWKTYAPNKPRILPAAQEAGWVAKTGGAPEVKKSFLSISHGNVGKEGFAKTVEMNKSEKTSKNAMIA